MKNKNKIKVMHIAQAAGGVSRYLQLFFKFSDREKFENILVCSFDYNIEDFKDDVDIIEQVDMKRSIGVNDLRSSLKLRKIIKKYEPDITYAHSSKAGAIVRIANIGLNNYCIYNPHGWAFNMHGSRKKQCFYVIIERLFAKFTDKIICISDSEKKSAIDNGICSEDKIKVIFNGIDIEEKKLVNNKSITRSLLSIPENAFVVGMVGRISQQKAPDIFVKAAKLIKTEYPDAYFIIVGDGEQHSEIENLIFEYGLSGSFLVTGWVENPLEYICLFDVALLLSRWEGFGLALAEYMLEGKPIVATKVDAIPDVVEEKKSGLLVEMDDYEAVFNEVKNIREDKTLAQFLIDNGLNRVKKQFDAKRVTLETEKLFSKVK